MNNDPKKTSEALAGLQAAAEYAARPTQPLEGARRTKRVQPMSASYRQAVDELRLWSESISAREEEWT